MLVRIPMFAGLDANDMAAVLRISNSQRFVQGEQICRQGEPGMCMFIICSGTAVVRLKDDEGKLVDIANLGAGQVLGELSLLDAQPRSAHVFALTEVEAIRIDRGSFIGLRSRKHPAAFKIMQGLSTQLCARLRNMNEQLAALVAGPADTETAPSTPRRDSIVEDRSQRRSVWTSLLGRLKKG